jgi:hypothetical protein
MRETKKSNLKWIRRISNLLDSKFKIPSTSIRFGLDPIFSIIPGLGDLSTYVVSLVIIYTIRRRGASGEVLIKMLVNASLDALVGSIPILGTIFDIWFKSNEKNLRLIHEYYEEGKHQGSGKGLLFMVIVMVVVVFAALLYIAWWAIAELIQLF